MTIVSVSIHEDLLANDVAFYRVYPRGQCPAFHGPGDIQQCIRAKGHTDAKLHDDDRVIGPYHVDRFGRMWTVAKVTFR